MLGSLPVATPTVSAQAPTSLGAGGEYFPVAAPARIFDTNITGKRAAANGEFTVNVVGVGGVPANDVLAVGVNVTIADATGPGFASVRPSDYDASKDVPTSLINFEAKGQTVPNFTIVGVGTEGKITIDIESVVNGDVRVIVDVFGWVAKSAYVGDDADEGARLRTVTPDRILDTRDSSSLGAKTSVKVPVRGQGPVPDSANVSAVVVNMTGVNNRSGSTGTYLAATPDKVPASAAEAPSSNGNYAPGTIKANLAIVPINADGSIYVYNRAGQIDVLLDVVGYLEEGGAEDSRSGRIVPLESPFRSFDTRTADFGKAKLGFSSWEDWSFKSFAGSVRLNGVEVGNQAGLFGNLTAVGLERLYPSAAVTSFLTLNPSTAAGFKKAPGNSNLNFAEGGAAANTSVVTYGTNGAGDDNMVSAYNANGRTHYILDVYAVILD